MVYDYFRQFWQLGIWTRIWVALLMDGREQAGKEASPIAAIKAGVPVQDDSRFAIGP